VNFPFIRGGTTETMSLLWILHGKRPLVASCIFAVAIGSAFIYVRMKRKQVVKPLDSKLRLTEQKSLSILAIQDIENWRKERDGQCRDPFGWLSLAGLHWLQKGENKMGTNVTSRVRIEVPHGTSTREGYVPEIGVIHYKEDDSFTFKAAPGVPVKMGENKLEYEEIPIRHDDNGKTDPDVLSLGSLQWFVIKRSDQFGVRLKDSNSPVLLNFKGIDNYPINLDLRIEGKFKSYFPPKMLQIPTAIGTIEKCESPGYISFEIDGTTHSLDVTGDPKTKLFVTFADSTSGKETYGGGRMLTLTVTESEKVLVDFNKSRNPPCAFTTFATCALPLPQNRLKISIRAGEKYENGIV